MNNMQLHDLQCESLSFLQKLMHELSLTIHQMPEYFEDDFYRILKESHPSLNEYLDLYYEECRRKKNENNT